MTSGNLSFVLLAACLAAPHAIADERPSTLAAKSGIWQDDRNGHETVNPDPEGTFVYGLSYARSMRLFTNAGSVAGSFLAGQRNEDDLESDRFYADIYFTQPTNEFLNFSLGASYEFAGDTEIQAGQDADSAETQAISVKGGLTSEAPLFGVENWSLISAFYLTAGHLTTDTRTLAVDRSLDQSFFGTEMMLGTRYDFGERKQWFADIRLKFHHKTTDFSSSTDDTQSRYWIASVGRKF